MSLFSFLSRKPKKEPEKPTVPAAIPFKPLDTHLLFHHREWKTKYMNMEPGRQIIECVFQEINHIPVTYVRDYCSTSMQRYEFTLDNIKDYNRVIKLEKQLEAGFDKKGVTIHQDGASIVIESPLNIGEFLCMGDMLMNEKYINSNRLTIPIGRTTANEDVFGDLEDLKHILVAGCSGSGKSVFLHTLILGLLAKHNDVDIHILDPKRVEFNRYNVLPNVNLVTEISDVPILLMYLVKMMEDRYTLLEQSGTRDIDSYNAKGGKMNHVVLIVDELGDIMSQVKLESEHLLVRLAQKARACGIHLVLATQYPTKDIVTGAIKQNMPTKICFAVPSTTASVVMMGKKGAERLMGKGDMLYQTEKDIEPVRLQGSLFNDIDIDIVIANARGFDLNKLADDVAKQLNQKGA